MKEKSVIKIGELAEWSSRSDAYGKSGGLAGLDCRSYCKRQMSFTYILKNLKDNKYYYGSTRNLEQRIKDHNRGKVKSTKGRRPLVIHYWEEYKNRSEARKREIYFKSIDGYNWLKEKGII